MDSMRPSMVTPQNQAPPPYYPSSGMENKALEHSMDLALALDDSKSAVYASQSGYGYHLAPHQPPHTAHAQQHPQNMTNADCKYLLNTIFTLVSVESPERLRGAPCLKHI